MESQVTYLLLGHKKQPDLKAIKAKLKKDKWKYLSVRNLWWVDLIDEKNKQIAQKQRVAIFGIVSQKKEKF